MLPPLRIRVAATTCRVPDVTLLDRSQPKEPTITHPPLAVFEILCSQDSLHSLGRKLEDYRIMGIPEIWVIDPQESTFSRYQDGQNIPNNTFSHAEKGITFDMNEIKKLLD